MAEDQETQHRGIVTVGIIMSPPEQETEKAADILCSSLKEIGSTIERWCPLQCNAHHYWIYDDSEKYNQDSRANIPYPRPTGASNSNIVISANNDVLTSGQVVFCTIMSCLGREYRIRTRMHKGE